MSHLTRQQPWATCSQMFLCLFDPLYHWSSCWTNTRLSFYHADWIEERGLEVWHLMFIASFSQEKESVLISFHVTSVQTCRWNAKYLGSWELLGIDSHWSLLFWYLTCSVKIGWLIFPVLQTSLVCIFINCVSRGLLHRDDEVMCVSCAKGRCQSPGH